MADDTPDNFKLLGDGEIGSKAQGLKLMGRVLTDRFPHDRFHEFRIEVPKLTVITTEWFDRFLAENNLDPSALRNDDDDRIARTFQKATLPANLVGDLRLLALSARTPFAVRSSSLLEDRKAHPFAGVYETKMLPNNQPEEQIRFQKLAEAVKFVYASTFLSAARDYRRAAGLEHEAEKMSVIVQEVVGGRFGNRFYPVISGVGRSYNYYPFGHAQPRDGVVSLALGLGKTVVDGGVAWTYAPTFPNAMPPHADVDELMNQTQTRFWAINMGAPPAYDPIRETEYLVEADLRDAEADESLALVASTYDAESDRLSSGCWGVGPRVLTFAPVLQDHVVPLNDLVSELLRVCEETVGSEVEIEFAVSFPQGEKPVFGFLQVRPMVVSGERVDLSDEEMHGPGALVRSERVLGNGVASDLRHVIYVKPETFDAKDTPRIAEELARVNAWMLDQGNRCALIGFGRWGSSDPWLGIPVKWGQISSARVIVEATLGNMNVDLSQGSHFFQDICAFRVGYFSVKHYESAIDWEWLAKQPAVMETEHVRVVLLATPLTVKMDGRTGKGAILK